MPSGTSPRPPSPAGTYDKLSWGSGNGFMVQKHDATRLHWDFAAGAGRDAEELGGARGPSLDPKENRLAVRTEDHPLSYATFEGTIPKGEYGGGTVMMWDRGTWASLPGKDPRKGPGGGAPPLHSPGRADEGRVGDVPPEAAAGEKNENWMLKKVTDDLPAPPAASTSQYLTSIKTGRSMQEIAASKRRRS
jgi:bifunctional non-homologous end joining protein LigD